MVKDGIKKGYTDIGKSRHSSYKSVEIKFGGGGWVEILGIKNEKGWLNLTLFVQFFIFSPDFKK